MNLWKKIMLGAATTFAVAAFSLGVASNPATASADMVKAASSNATATDGMEGKVTVDLGRKTLRISSGLDVPTVKVYFPTAKDTKDGLVNLGTPLVLDYDGDEVIVDLSSLSESKDNYIYVKAGDDFAAFKIAATTKIKTTVDKKTGKLKAVTSKDIKVSGNSVAKGTELKFSQTDVSGNASYNTATRFVKASGDASALLDLGATVETRMNAIQYASGNAVAGPKSSAQKYLEIGTFVGPVSKVKIPKRANAPKIAINYEKGTVTLPNKVLYRVNDNNASYNATATSKKTVLATVSGEASGNATIDISASTIKIGSKNYTINAKTEATDKKPESRQAEVTIPAVVKVSGDGKTVSANASADAEAKLDGDNVTCTYKKDIKKVTIAAGSKYAYQYVISSSAPTATTKWSTVKAGKSATKAISSGNTLYVRRAGSSTDMAFPSNYLKAITVTS